MAHQATIPPCNLPPFAPLLSVRSTHQIPQVKCFEPDPADSSGGNGSRRLPERSKVQISRPAEPSNLHPVRNHRRHITHACDPCRHKKTKCTGESTGCRNCAGNTSKCHYTDGKREQSKKQLIDIKRKFQVKEQLVELMVEQYNINSKEIPRLEKQAASMVKARGRDDEMAKEEEAGDDNEAAQAPVHGSGNIDGGSSMQPTYISGSLPPVNLGYKREEEDSKFLETLANGAHSTNSQSNPQFELSSTLSTVKFESTLPTALNVESGINFDPSEHAFDVYDSNGTQFGDSLFQPEDFEFDAY
ncbi:hypothetical protein BJX70DRAFT_200492 [Aspergillus crustosus]